MNVAKSKVMRCSRYVNGSRMDVSEWFPVDVGLRQGCVISLWLFKVHVVVYGAFTSHHPERW